MIRKNVQIVRVAIFVALSLATAQAITTRSALANPNPKTADSAISAPQNDIPPSDNASSLDNSNPPPPDSAISAPQNDIPPSDNASNLDNSNPADTNSSTGDDLPTAPDMAQLSKTIAQLQTNDTDAICKALDSMARLCDQRCVPYIADALRHEEPRVVEHAANVARILAHPRLLPALESVIWHHTDDEVKLEALRAAIAIIIARDDDTTDTDLYRALFDALRVDQLDELLRKLVRSLPENLRHAYATPFVKLAQNPAFVSSVVAAYRRDPKTLFDAICHQLLQAPSDDVQKQWIRAARLIVEQNSNFDPNSASYEVLSLLPPSLDEDTAIVMAALSTPYAAQWLVAHLPNLSKPTQYAVFQHIHGDGSEIVTRTILNAPDDSPYTWTTIAQNKALSTAFIEKIPPIDAPEIRAFVDLLFKSTTDANDDQLSAAIPILRAFPTDPSIRQRIISLLGHDNPQIAYAAQAVAASHPAYWNELVDIVTASPNDDNWGKTLLARYALAQIPTPIPNADIAIADAQKVLASPSRLHALPALWLLRSLGAPFDLPSPAEFAKLRPEMKRAYVEALPNLLAIHENAHITEDNSPSSSYTEISNKSFDLIRAALLPSATDDAIPNVDAASAALWALSQMPTICPRIARDAKLVDQISRNLESPDPRLSAHASLAIAQCGMTQFIPSLNNRIVDPDPVIAYDALIALQKLRALPDPHWLKVLYYRTKPSFLRDKLAFFAGLGAAPTTHNAIRDLETGRPLRKGQIARISTPNRPLPQEYVQIMLEDQSVIILKSSNSAFFYVPN